MWITDVAQYLESFNVTSPDSTCTVPLALNGTDLVSFFHSGLFLLKDALCSKLTSAVPLFFVTILHSSPKELSNSY